MLELDGGRVPVARQTADGNRFPREIPKSVAMVYSHLGTKKGLNAYGQSSRNVVWDTMQCGAQPIRESQKFRKNGAIPVDVFVTNDRRFQHPPSMARQVPEIHSIIGIRRDRATLVRAQLPDFRRISRRRTKVKNSLSSRRTVLDSQAGGKFSRNGGNGPTVLSFYQNMKQAVRLQRQGLKYISSLMLNHYVLNYPEHSTNIMSNQTIPLSYNLT